MNAKQPTHIANPGRALDLIETMLSGDVDALWNESDRAFESNSLHDIDLSCLVLIHATLNYSANVSNLYAHPAETWRSIFDITARGKNSIATHFNLNAHWLGEDVVGFLQNCVLPAIGTGTPNISVPTERGEGVGTPFDEVFIHVAASVFCAIAVLQGVAATSPKFGSLEVIISKMREYLNEEDNADGQVDILTDEELQEELDSDHTAVIQNNRRVSRSRLAPSRS